MIELYVVRLLAKSYYPVCIALILSGCLPVPVSRVPLHPREERPVAYESVQSENFGAYSVPAFDSGGSLLAVYDSGSDMVRILRSSDLAPLRSFRPVRRPRRLSFSPKGNFLVIESHAGWIDDYLKNRRSSSSHIDIDSPEAVRDNVQRAEVWDLRTEKTVSGLSCDDVVTSEPEGGWLWASKWAITPGYRSSALLEAHFTSDESEFSMLCWNGIQQRWNIKGWARLDNIPPPPFWDAIKGATTAQWLSANEAAGRSDDARLVLLRFRERSSGFPTIYIWDKDSGEPKKLPGCAARLQPAFSVSADAGRIVAVCNSGLGNKVIVWDLATEKELPLSGSDFGFAAGSPVLRSEGVAISPDGRFVAVSLLRQMEALIANVLLVPAALSRSDLRIWSVDGGNELVSVPIDDLDAGTNALTGVDLAFSPDSRTLAVAGRRIRLYRLKELVPALP